MVAVAFETGDSDEPPDWALPLVYRRMLWKEYGIVVPDFMFSDFVDAIHFHGMEAERRRNLARRDRPK